MWLTAIDREYLRRSREVAALRHGPRHLGDLVWEHVTTLRILICKERGVLRERSVPIEERLAEDVELPLLRWSDGDALWQLTQPLVHSSHTSIELMARSDHRQGQKRRGKTLIAPHRDRPPGQGLVLKGIGQFVLPQFPHNSGPFGAIPLANGTQDSQDPDLQLIVIDSVEGELAHARAMSQ